MCDAGQLWSVKKRISFWSPGVSQAWLFPPVVVLVMGGAQEL